MDALLGTLLDVAADRVEQAAGGRRRSEAERDAELAVEVAATERGIVVVGESKPGGWDAVAKRTKDTGLADARLTDEDNGSMLGKRIEERVDDDLLGGRQPQFPVGNLLRKRRLVEREVGEIGGGHDQSSSGAR